VLGGAVLASLLVPGIALACDLRFANRLGAEDAAVRAPAVARIDGSCPKDPADRDPIEPTQVIEGEFAASLQGSYVMLPFSVPRRVSAVRVRYCFDQPDAKPSGSPIANTLDLGLYEARSGPDDLWDRDEFRGWGGSSHPDVTVSRAGFSSEADYLASPKTHVRGRTTRGFRPGPIRRGLWAVELGVASVTPEDQGDSDGKVAWRVEIETIRDRAYGKPRYRPARYDHSTVRGRAGWFAGDLHVHAEHSSLGDATMRKSFDFAFRSLAQNGAGLDFITLSDYVTDTGWGEIGRFQAHHPGRLIIPSSEVITYRGHINNHSSHRFVDYRTGPLLEQLPDGTYRRLRAARPASEVFDAIQRAGGWTQINHPTIFPSEVPGFSSLCRGCPWDYDPQETRYSKVDAIEIATGPAGLKQDPEPGFNPFTTLAIDFYERALDTGARIAAVGSSDSHRAGETGSSAQDQITQSPIGQATTVVYAPQLSERGIQEGVKRRHTYVKIFGNDGPDLRFEARSPGSDVPPAIMGDLVRASSARMTARVLGAGSSAARPGPYGLFVYRNGDSYLSAPVTGDDFSFGFDAGPGRYRLQLMRLSGVGAIEAVSSPIWVAPGAAEDPPFPPRGRCANPLGGLAGADRIHGTRGGDLIAAVGGNDRISGGRGRDCLYGGQGRDWLLGGAARDRLRGGVGRDRLIGGAGNDRIKAAGGGSDRVRCGSGADLALADARDRVRGCEQVRRPAAD
jgi:hypothetical protein